MKVYVVLYQDDKTKETDVLDVYTDEEKANRRVSYERDLIKNGPYSGLKDDCWYQEREIIA
ncbi:hypothetical protein ACDI16_02165 [Oceanobacillus caeni]